MYRSSYKNARRLAATETNIAYRTADHERWQQFDFVVGIKVSLSNNHTLNGVAFTDICDDLAGSYPKDFKFTGWHPLCRCHAVPVLKTLDEIKRDNDAILQGGEPSEQSVNTVSNVPEKFNAWGDNNRERAKGWSNMPYFIRQNPQYVQGFEVNTYTAAERKFTRARSTNEAMKESLGIYLQSKYPEMPNTEKAAIYHYTKGEGVAFRHLNKQLRAGELSEFNEAFSQLLSQGLSKLETTTETVYRTMRLNRTDFNSFIQFADNKLSKIFKGFTSSSFDRKTAMDFAENKKNQRKTKRMSCLLYEASQGIRLRVYRSLEVVLQASQTSVKYCLIKDVYFVLTK